MKQLNSVLPAAVKGCGRSRSIAWQERTRTDEVSPVGKGVMGQVGMKVEGGDIAQETQGVEVVIGVERHDLVGAFHHGRAESVLVHHRNIQPLHQRPGVLAEPLLPRHQGVPVMFVLHLPLLQVRGKAAHRDGGRSGDRFPRA